MSWKEVLAKIAKKVGLSLLWVAAFLLWVITNILETQLKELNKALRRFLFPPKQ